MDNLEAVPIHTPIPSELWEDIFGFSSGTELTNSRAVSRRWKAIIEDGYKFLPLHRLGHNFTVKANGELEKDEIWKKKFRQAKRETFFKRCILDKMEIQCYPNGEVEKIFETIKKLAFDFGGLIYVNHLTIFGDSLEDLLRKHPKLLTNFFVVKHLECHEFLSTPTYLRIPLAESIEVFRSHHNFDTCSQADWDMLYDNNGYPNKSSLDINIMMESADFLEKLVQVFDKAERSQNFFKQINLLICEPVWRFQDDFMQASFKLVQTTKQHFLEHKRKDGWAIRIEFPRFTNYKQKIFILKLE